VIVDCKYREFGFYNKKKLKKVGYSLFTEF
jgi:hypothetical protein